MKKIISLLVVMLVILTLASCSEGEVTGPGGDKSAVIYVSPGTNGSLLKDGESYQVSKPIYLTWGDGDEETEDIYYFTVDYDAVPNDEKQKFMGYRVIKAKDGAKIENGVKFEDVAKIEDRLCKYNDELAVKNGDALYLEAVYGYTVTFDLAGGALADGTTKVTVDVEAGTMPSVDFDNPTKPFSNGTLYKFAGWTPEITAATDNVTYTASYDEDVLEPGEIAYTLEDGVLTVYGNGEMPDYMDWVGDEETEIGGYGRPWESHIESVTKVIIEDGITRIGAQAFFRHPNLVEVEMADSVTSASVSCFEECPKLTTVKLSENIKLPIEGYALDNYDCLNMFDGCEALNSVELPEGIEYIPSSMFFGCSSLTNVVLPDTVQLIDYRAFAWCEALESIELPAGLKIIEYQAFLSCSSLTSLVIPEGVEQIVDMAFEDTGLTTVTIPSTVRELGEALFSDCDNLQTVICYCSEAIVTDAVFTGCNSEPTKEFKTNA